MKDMNLNGCNLGDLTSAFADQKPLSDLGWLELTPGENYDNYPSESPREVIPQLQAQWSLEKFTSPTQLIPNQVGLGTSTKENKIGPDDIFEVTRVAKKAMMQGHTGKEVLSQLRERFAREVLEASQDELKNVAAEEGLLGNVYVDLSVYASTKEALSHLGHHKTRLASFAVGVPQQEKNYVDASGKCRHLAKTVVPEVPYGQEVLAYYSTHLKNIGAIPKTASIETKEHLRAAFLMARKRVKSAQDETAVTPIPMEVDPKEQKAQMASLQAEKTAAQKKQAALVRLSHARPILAKIQDIMLKGKMGDDLKEGIRSSCDSMSIQQFAPEIGNLVRRQGLVGPVLVDVSVYPDVPKAMSAVKSSFMKPQFLVSTLPSPEGMAETVSTRTGVPLLKSASDLTHKHAYEIVAKLHGAGRLNNQVASTLSRLAQDSLETPANIIQSAMKSSMEQADDKTVRMAEVPMGHIHNTASYTKPLRDRKDLVEGAKKAVDAGLSSTAIQSKIATIVPFGEAIGIMKEALAAMDTVRADSLDECQSQKYSLKKTASLICGGKCGGCTFSIGGSCSRQGRPFQRSMPRMASTQAPEMDIVSKFQLGGNSIDLDLSSAVTPPRRPAPLDITLKENDFRF